MKLRESNKPVLFIYSFARAIYISLRNIGVFSTFRKNYRLDRRRYLQHSRTLNIDTPDKKLGVIILLYHVVEKGLTMRDTRPGFGSERVIALCRACSDYLDETDSQEPQVLHAVRVLREYEEYHRRIGHPIDDEITSQIARLGSKISGPLGSAVQHEKERNKYFENSDSNFAAFSRSRSSVRNYSSEPVPLQLVQDSLELARTTPSACNRQCWRTYVFTEREKVHQILEMQGGNRGFGHLADKVILVAAELGGFCNTNERNQAFIDGGMYAMNLLYSLHYHQIAACILNCSFDFQKERAIKNFCGVKESEVLIAMISLGMPPEKFLVACSPRYSVFKTNQIIET